ncbi:MAG TPA: cysteine peptidase family C39 domain-containing protein [Candidatus Babeliaceae bacterium]|nr:cysteine peptidase family C39 domain-containing protein [Candidatus Babeliaceae bacterium]
MKINTRNSKILRRTFVRQLTDHDCGPACIAMLLRYAGQSEKANDFLAHCSKGNQSLFALREDVQQLGFSSQCVTMTLDFLSEIENPCILHTEDETGNKHYQVCYGATKSRYRKQFLLADPANQFYFIDERHLDQIWKTKAALYVEGLSADLYKYTRSPIALVVSFADVPGIVWIIMPVLTLINAIFGIALSFLLQRGFIYTDIFSSPHIIVAFVILLLIISVFKGAFSYLRQIILLKINRTIRQHLFNRLTGRIDRLKVQKAAKNPEWIKRSFYEISLIQNALSIFVSTFVSEGSLLIIMLAAIFYTVPVAGLILATFFCLLIINLLYTSSANAYTNSIIRQKSAVVEKSLTNSLFINDYKANEAIENENKHIYLAEQQAILLSRKGFIQDFMGALAVVIILGITSFRLSDFQMSYPSLMFVVILSYVAISITPRLYSAYLTLIDGADAFVQFYLRTTN